MLVAICYDVVDDNRRLALSKFLDGLADRVQRSVFEGRLDEATLSRLTSRAARIIDPAQDSVRVYPLCARCRRQVTVIGRGTVTPEEPTIVI